MVGYETTNKQEKIFCIKTNWTCKIQNNGSSEKRQYLYNTQETRTIKEWFDKGKKLHSYVKKEWIAEQINVSVSVQLVEIKKVKKTKQHTGTKNEKYLS